MKTKLLLTSILFTLINFLTAQIVNVPGDQPTIQAGINAANDGEMVVVEDGTYYENIDFKGKAITVCSNFHLDGDTTHISNTIINGSQPSHPDTAAVVRFVSGEDTTSILCGFTITDGSGIYMEPFIFYQAGGGIFCFNSGAKIINNYIVNDSIDTNIQGIGAGIYAGPNGSDSWLILKNNLINENYIYTTTTDYFAMGSAVATECNCIIQGNEILNNTSISKNRRASGAVLCRGLESPRFIDISENNISHNSTYSLVEIDSRVYAGALYILYNYGRIKNNTIMYNEVGAENTDGICYGAGITTLFTDTSLSINNNTIAHNKYSNGFQCTGGGIFLYNATARIINNLIYDNQATHGGGIAITDTDPDNTQIINNTIVGNSAEFGGGIYVDQDSAVVINTIVYDNISPNLGAQIFDFFNTISICYSNIQNLTPWPGIGNINQEPLFVDPENGNFHLDNCLSPCINAGRDVMEINGSVYYCPTYDMDNETRPYLNTLPDMGADETPCLGTSTKNTSNTFSQTRLNNYPNPFSNQTSIEFNIPKSTYVKLILTNNTGTVIQTLITEILSAGIHQFNWKTDGLPAGIYFLRLETKGICETRKLILVK